MYILARTTTKKATQKGIIKNIIEKSKWIIKYEVTDRKAGKQRYIEHREKTHRKQWIKWQT